MLLLNPQVHIDVLLPKLLNQILILSVNKFGMIPLLMTLSIPHMKYMYHHLSINGNIMQEKIGKNI